MSASRIIRVAIAAVLIGAWLLLRYFQPAWANIIFAPLVNIHTNFGWWGPAVGGGLLAALLISYVFTKKYRLWLVC